MNYKSGEAKAFIVSYLFSILSSFRRECSPFIGTPEGIRIPDLPLRRRTLYPAELLVHVLPGYCTEKM